MNNGIFGIFGQLTTRRFQWGVAYNRIPTLPQNSSKENKQLECALYLQLVISIAQLVQRLPTMRGIVGSNPILGTYTIFFFHFFLTLNMLYDETLLEKNIFLNVTHTFQSKLQGLDEKYRSYPAKTGITGMKNCPFDEG